MSRFDPTTLVLLSLLLGLTSACAGSQGDGRAASQGSGATSDGTTDDGAGDDAGDDVQGGEDGPEDGEGADPPVDVAGAFLTQRCGPAAANPDLEEGLLPVGCGIYETEKEEKYDGDVNFVNVTVAFGEALPQVSPELTNAKADSPWHTLFGLTAEQLAQVQEILADVDVPGASRNDNSVGTADGSLESDEYENDPTKAPPESPSPVTGEGPTGFKTTLFDFDPEGTGRKVGE